jgi:hypothetical protein
VSLNRDSRHENKLKALRWAHWRFKQRLQTIDWLEDSLLPEIEALKSGKSVLGLPDGVAFDIVIEDENHSPSTPSVAADSSEHDSTPTD